MDSTTPKTFIYLIQAGNTRKFKVGISQDPDRRLGYLQTGNPDKLHFGALWIGTRKDESAIHRLLVEYRQSGEWFECPPEYDIQGLIIEIDARLEIANRRISTNQMRERRDTIASEPIPGLGHGVPAPPEKPELPIGFWWRMSYWLFGLVSLIYMAYVFGTMQK